MSCKNAISLTWIVSEKYPTPDFGVLGTLRERRRRLNKRSFASLINRDGSSLIDAFIHAYIQTNKRTLIPTYTYKQA